MHEVLCSLFLDVYNVARDKDALAGELWKVGVVGVCWEIQFNLQSQVWELESFLNFYNISCKFRPS